MHNVMAEVNPCYELSQNLEDNIIEEMKKLLDEYDYEYEDFALRKIVRRWASEKGRVINTLSKHPNWNPEKFQIKFTSDYKREINLDQITRFFNWCVDAYIKKNEINTFIKPFNMAEVAEIKERLSVISDCIRSLKYRGIKDIKLNGIDASEYVKDRNKFEDYYENHFGGLNSGYINGNIVYFDKETTKIRDKIIDLSCCINDYLSTHKEDENIHLCSKELCDIINARFPDHAKPGQKLSKVLTQIGKTLGIDDVVEIRNISFYDNNGNFVEREKNYGWAYQQTQMGDAINPMTIKRHTIISVNPIDYLTMSFGHKWGSCHGIDKGRREGNNYSGEYSAGTISYMLDPSSIIFYTVDEEYNGTKFELQDKMQRAVFAIGGDKLYEGRVYPDGRDNGDQGYAPQFRTIMQKVIADCLEVDNLWRIEKGTSACSSNMSNMGGCAYDDWTCCSDSVMSFLKIDDTINTEDEININASAICIQCGYEHDDHENINCCEGDSVVCERCGARISEDEAICTEDGNWYCDSECAGNDDYYYCDDAEGYYYQPYYDDYDNEYFHYDGDMVCAGGNTYRNIKNAEADGWRWCENINEWCREEETCVDDYTGENFYPNGDDVETEDGCHFASEYNAEKAGYICDPETGKWHKDMEETA